MVGLIDDFDCLGLGTSSLEWLARLCWVCFCFTYCFVIVCVWGFLFGCYGMGYIYSSVYDLLLVAIIVWLADWLRLTVVSAHCDIATLWYCSAVDLWCMDRFCLCILSLLLC